MNDNKSTDFLVVGAGIAGISCAADIEAAGQTVCLVDKGRGVGGRFATRRLEISESASLRVDHGAPYLAVQNPRLQEQVRQWQEDGWLQPCFQTLQYRSASNTIAREEKIAGQPTLASQLSHPPLYAPTIGVNEIAKRMVAEANLDVTTSFTATGIRRVGEIWNVTGTDAAGKEATFSGHALILNLPPSQLLTIARGSLPVTTVSDLEAVHYHPTWTLILRLGEDLPVEWDAVRFPEHPVLKWIIRDHTKRLPNAPPVLVIHAASEWSRKFLEEEKPSIQSVLMDAVSAELGTLPTVLEAQAHRWRYAYPETFFPEPCFWHPEIRLGGCGDWASTARGENRMAEGAIESGWDLAKRCLPD